MGSAALAPSDVKAVLDAALDLARSTSRDDLFERVLLHTAALIETEVTSFNWMAPGRVAVIIRPQPEPPAWFAELTGIFTQHWLENPLAAHFERTADTRALTWEDVEEDQIWRDGVLYRDFFVPMNVKHQMAVRFPSPPGTVAGLACNRSSTPFDDRDRAVLTTFGRHAFALLDTMTEQTALRAAIGQRGWATVLVDADCRLIGGPTGTNSISDGEFLRPPLRQVIERQLVSSGDGAMVPGEPEEVVLADGRYAAFAVPSAMPPYLLFVRQLTAEEPVAGDLSALSSVGLSARESAVAAHLATGATNRQIADRLGITVGTVKKHIQRIFSVLGVETRAAAAATTVRLLG